jgi:hypothetical protein
VEKMGISEKTVEIPNGVIEQIQNDLQNNGVKIYEIPNVPRIFVDNNLIHPNIVDRCTSVVAALSASPGEGRNYMFLVGTRIDYEKGKTLTDLDPVVMVSELPSGTPAPSGVIRFHGDFEGRTELLVETTDVRIDELREQVKGEELSFDKAPKRFTAAMHHMAKIYKKKLG